MYFSARGSLCGFILLFLIKKPVLWFRLEITCLLWFLMIPKALALKMALEAKGLTSNVYVGMRYWFPFTEEAVQQVRPYTLDQM
jgi:hypothetical protein